MIGQCKFVLLAVKNLIFLLDSLQILMGIIFALVHLYLADRQVGAVVGNPFITGGYIRKDKSHFNCTFAVFQPFNMVLLDLSIQIVDHLFQRFNCPGQCDIFLLNAAESKSCGNLPVKAHTWRA